MRFGTCWNQHVECVLHCSILAEVRDAANERWGCSNPQQRTCPSSLRSRDVRPHTVAALALKERFADKKNTAQGNNDTQPQTARSFSFFLDLNSSEKIMCCGQMILNGSCRCRSGPGSFPPSRDDTFSHDCPLNPPRPPHSAKKQAELTGRE